MSHVCLDPFDIESAHLEPYAWSKFNYQNNTVFLRIISSLFFLECSLKYFYMFVLSI
jgi:hypothetical protein